MAGWRVGRRATTPFCSGCYPLNRPSCGADSAALVREVDARIRNLGDAAPCLTRLGLLGDGPFSPAEILGSLGVSATGEIRPRADFAHRLGYQAAFHALEFQSRCERRAGIEPRWREAWLWLLLALASLLDIGCFYHHLKETLAADPARVSRIKSRLRRMRRQAFEARRRLERLELSL